MRTFEKFLIWYNNLDIKPFLEVIKRQSQVYKDKNIGMLKSAISLPGLAIKWLFRDTRQRIAHQCVTRQPEMNGDLHRAFRKDCMVHLIDMCDSDLYNLIQKILLEDFPSSSLITTKKTIPGLYR